MLGFGKGERGRVDESAYTPVHENVDPDLPVQEGINDVSPLEAIGLRNLGAVVGLLTVALVLEPVNNKGSFFLGQESRRVRVVVDGEESNAGDDDRGDTYNLSSTRPP